MANSTTNIAQITTAQASKEVTANGLFDAASPAMFGGRRAEACAGLVWGYYGGYAAGNSVSNGTLTLTGSTTNYVVANLSTGAITAATTTTNWNNSAAYARLYSIVTGTATVTSYTDYRDGLNANAKPIEIQVSLSDLATSLTTGTNNAYFRAPCAMTITDIRASLLVASTSGAVTVDVNVNASTILSTKLTIDQDEKTSVTAATPHVRSSSALADDDEVRFDIDGAGTGAKGLIVTVIGVRS